jgi:hypothetical protein
LHPTQQTHRNHWFPLHEYAIANWDNWDWRAARKFVREWVAAIPDGGCNCPANWAAHKITIRTDTPEHFFADANDAHNVVSKSIDKPELTLGQAYGIWRKRGEYETDLEHLADNRVDVVIPYCNADVAFVDEAIRSIIDQEHIEATIHVAYDSPTKGPSQIKRLRSFAAKRSRIIRYESRGRMGPYRIANAVVEHCKTNYLALLDADDIATPDRLWRQLATMQRFGYEMTSGSMVNFCQSDEPSLELRRQQEIVIESGVEFSHVPVGRCVNSVRTMSLAMFRRLRGFTPETCSMDFDFDNRAHFAGVPTFWGSDIVGRRRLHSASLTNGPEYAHHTQLRKTCNQICRDNLSKLQASPTEATARSFGGLTGCI